jgi:hypothetical protein|tara:strand:- start:612 stop:2345 length:1734 start_codon:yes stop_codon:yes gene_type:complete
MVDVYIPEQKFDQNVHDQYFDNAKAGTLDVLGATLDETMYYNPVNALGRIAEQKLGRGRQGRNLTREEYLESEYYREGLTVGTDGITEGLASLLADRHDERSAFQTTLSRSRGGFGLGAAQFGVALAGSVIDPLNVASAFIPSVAVARGATMAAKIRPSGAVRAVRQRLDGKTSGSRFATGTIDGAIGAVAVEPLVIGAAALEGDDDYTLMDSFLNVALGSALGGGLHWGAGKISDRINKLPAPTRDQAQRTSVAQLALDKEVEVTKLIDNVEKTNVAKVEEQAGKKIVYNSDGEPKVVDVIDISKDGTITVRDVDGTEKILDASDLRGKSPFDEDYEVNDIAVSSMTETELNTQIADLEANLQTARESNDAVLSEKLATDRKAIEVEMDRRAGKTIERPVDPNMEQAIEADLATFQKQIDDIRAKAEKRKNKRITAAEQKKLAELQEKIAVRQTQLQEASALVNKQQGVLTAQQADNIAEDTKLDDGGAEALLGRLAEHKDAVDEMAADKPVMDEIDLNEFEAENARLQEDLQNEEMQAVLPADLKKSIEETKQIDEKASKFEEISRAGAACILRR